MPRSAQKPAHPILDTPTFRREEWPFHWITRTGGRYFQVMTVVLKPLDLDVAQWRVLMCLSDKTGLSISEIADLCIIKLNTTTKIVQRMQADGLVTCRARKTDGRVTEVRLTAKGKELRITARTRAEKVFAHAFEGLEPAQIATMNAALEHVFQRLDEF